MNPFVNVFTDTVDFDQVEWDDFTSLIATTDDIKLLLEWLNEQASSTSLHAWSGHSKWALRMYAWVTAMTDGQVK